MVQIVARDIDLLRWVNGHGFVMAGQVARWMGVHEKVAGRRLRKLEDAGVIERERVFLRGGSVVRATKAGAELAGDGLAVPKNLRLGTYEHDRATVALSLDLLERHRGSRFVPERRLRHERGKPGGHMIDGLLILGNGDRVAIELELSRKQRWRLRKIVGGLARDMSLNAVWYFCAADVVDLVEEVVGDDELFAVTVLEAAA